jgi:hypothetical protein
MPIVGNSLKKSNLKISLVFNIFKTVSRKEGISMLISIALNSINKIVHLYFDS